MAEIPEELMIAPATVEGEVLNVAPPTPTLDLPDAARRSHIYSQAMGELSPGTGALQATLTSGGDLLARQMAQMRWEEDLNRRRTALLRRYMAERGSTPPDQDELAFLRALDRGTLTQLEAGDPSTVFERMRAIQANRLVNPPTPDAPNNTGNQDVVNRINENATRLQALADYAHFRLEALEAEHRNDPISTLLPNVNPLISDALRIGAAASGVGNGRYQDPFGQILSPLQWYRQMNIFNRPGNTTYLLGNNRLEQADWYYRQSLDNGRTALDNAIEQLRGQNLETAIAFARAIATQSREQADIANLFAVLDIAPFTGWIPYAATGAALAQAGRRIGSRLRTPPPTPSTAIHTPGPGATASGSVVPPPTIITPTHGTAEAAHAQAASDVAQAAITNRGYPNMAPVVEASGDLVGAARITVREQLLDDVSRTGQVHSFDMLEGMGRPVFHPQYIVSEAGTSLSNEAAQRLVTRLSEQGEQLATAIRNVLQPRRLPQGGEAELQAVENARNIAMSHQYAHLSHRVLTVDYPKYAAPLTTGAMLPGIRPFADKVINLEKQIMKRERLVQYNQYYNARDQLKAAIDQLVSMTGHSISKRARDPYRLSPKWLNSPRGDVLDVVNKAQSAIREIKAIPAADRKLFDAAHRADQEYLSALSKMATKQTDLPGNAFIRPSGFGPRPLQGMTIVEGAGGTRSLAIRIGTRHADLFRSESQALSEGLNELGLKNFRVKQLGTGYYIEVLKSIDETAVNVRQALARDIERMSLETLRPYNHAYPATFWSSGRNLRQPADVATDAIAATYNSSKMASDISRLINNSIAGATKIPGVSRMSKQSIKDFNRYIEYERQFIDPSTGKLTPTWAGNQMELETNFRQVIGRPLSENEALAYWTYRQIYAVDKVLMDMGIYAEKARAGVEHFWFRTVAGDVETPNIEGKLLAQLPDASVLREGRAGIIIWDKVPGAAQHVYFNMKGSQKVIDAALQSGAKIVQISHFGEDALKASAGFPPHLRDRSVHFVLARDIVSSPLPYQQTPNQMGGHIRYKHEFYIRQPDVRNGTYYGDLTVFGARHADDARQWVKMLEQARQIRIRVENGSISEDVLEKFLKDNLPMSLAEFKATRFDVPFVFNRQGQRLWETANRNVWSTQPLKDIRDHPLTLYNLNNTRYAMERQGPVDSVVRWGTEDNPILKRSTPELMDPMVTMDRAVKHLVNNANFGNYQIKATERFIAEFGHLLDAPMEQLYRDPVNALVNVPFKAGTSGVDRAAAERFRAAASELLSIKSDAQWQLHHIGESMADTLYRRVGDIPFKLEDTAFGRMIDHPIEATKNGVFYWNMLHPKQLFIQMTGFLHIGAVAGWAAAADGMVAAAMGKMIHTYPRADLLNHIATGVAKISNWRVEHFKEAYKAGLDHGFFHVGKEYALLDQSSGLNMPIIQNMGRQVVELGSSFYRTGESGVRHIAFFTAYKEWRYANPTADFTDDVYYSVVRRADTLTASMSSASQSRMQSMGISRLTTTFWGYQMRILEQLAGGQLNRAQAARVAANYAILFGGPAVAGTMLFGLPVTEWVRNRMTEQGVAFNNDTWPDMITNFAINGLLQVAGEEVTGAQLDLAALSPSNNRFLSQMLGQETGSPIRWLLGAPGGMVADLYQAAHPYYYWISTLGDYRMTAREFIGPLMQQKGLDQTSRGIYALTTGELYSRSGLQVDRVNTMEAALYSLTGIQPFRITQMYGILSNENALRETQIAATRRIETAFIQWHRAMARGDTDSAETYWSQIRFHIAAARFTPQQQIVMMRRIHSRNDTLVERTMLRFGRGSAEGERLYRRYQQLRGQ